MAIHQAAFINSHCCILPTSSPGGSTVSHWPHPVSFDDNLFGSFWQEPMNKRTIKRHMKVAMASRSPGLPLWTTISLRLSTQAVFALGERHSVTALSLQCPQFPAVIYFMLHTFLTSITETMLDKLLTYSTMLTLWDQRSRPERTSLIYL